MQLNVNITPRYHILDPATTSKYYYYFYYY